MNKVILRVEYENTNLSSYQLVNALRILSPKALVTAVTDKRVVGGGYHRPICPKCHVEMRPERNGVGVLDMADWGPYSLWDSDLWKCPECGVEVIGGFGEGPISAHYEDDFKRLIETYRKKDALVENRG